MNELEAMSSQGLCELLMPRIAWKEAEKGEDHIRKDKTWSYYYIELTENNHQKYWFKEIEKILFPYGANSKSKINDIWILVTAREMKYPLITDDGDSKTQPGGILGNRKQLENIGVSVLRDYEAVAKVKEHNLI